MALPLARFVAENRASWTELEALLARLGKTALTVAEVESLDRLYRRASADLARARMHYPATEVAQHLNQLVSRTYAAVYGARASRWAALRRFYAEGLPRIFYAERRFFYAAAGLLLSAAWMGAAAAIFHPEVVPALVPLALREHIAAGQMWTDSILSVMPPALLSAQIFTHNISVAFAVFLGGLPLGLGTLLVLWVNGLELGAVAALCLQRGMGPDFLSFVCAHGLVELSVVALAGQAGLVLASGLVAPGWRSRAEALRVRGRIGVQLVLGSAPMLLGIGLVEGFISPGNLFPGPLRAAIGLTLAALLYGYLFGLGRRVGRAPAGETSEEGD